MTVLLSLIGAKYYTLLGDRLSLTLPKEKTLLKQHLEPKRLTIAERFHFHRRNQGPEESIAHYVAELRRLAVHC